MERPDQILRMCSSFAGYPTAVQVRATKDRSGTYNYLPTGLCRPACLIVAERSGTSSCSKLSAPQHKLDCPRYRYQARDLTVETTRDGSGGRWGRWGRPGGRSLGREARGWRRIFQLGPPVRSAGRFEFSSGTSCVVLRLPRAPAAVAANVGGAWNLVPIVRALPTDYKFVGDDT